jgi:hypothetical protein
VSSAAIGWALAVAALAAGFLSYGWRGLVLALSVIVFWLLLQFSRTMRVLRNAAGSPVGHVASAVMLNAKMRVGAPMAEVIGLARSLGRKVSEQPQVFVWRDVGGVELEVEFENGRCRRWCLNRPPDVP